MKDSKSKIFFCIGIFFIIAGLSLLLINIPSIKNIVFEICAKVKGQPLNIENTIIKLHSFIIMNSFISILIGAGFITLNFVKFESSLESKDFSILYNKKEISKFTVFSIIIFILLVAIRIFWCTQKVNYHMDELYGIGIVNKNKYNFWTGSLFPTNIPFSGSFIKNEVLFDDNSLKDFIKDIANLWFYNCDSAYTSLFLMLFRLSFIFTKTYDFSTIILHGFILNLIFFCISFYIFNRLLKLISNNKILNLFLSIIAFANPASISISIFLRAYALQETILILFTYFFVWFYQNIKNETQINSIKNFIKGTILIGVVLSSDYFTLFYVAIFGIFIITTCIKEKKIELITYFIAMAFCSLLIAKCLYLNWGSGLLTDRGQEALSKTSFIQSIPNTILEMNNLISNNFINFLFLMLCFFINPIYFFYCKKIKIKFDLTTTIISLFSLLWIFLVLYIAPYKTMRYIAAVFPMLSLVFCFSISNKIVKKIQFLLISFISIFVVKNIVPLDSNYKNIEHIQDTPIEHSNAKYKKDISIPVVIYVKSNYTEILPYLDDNQIYYFTNSLENAKKLNLDKFWYVSYESEKYSFSEILYEKK